MAKEITRVTTLDLTHIFKTDNQKIGLCSQAEYIKRLEIALKYVLGVDNAVIKQVQDFEMDKE